MPPIPYIGEILSVAAALFWGIAVILFKLAGDAMPPLALNGFKNVLAVALLTITLVAAQIPLVPAMPMRDWVILFASGVVGISIADTMFFWSLEKLGAGLTAVVDTIYTPFILSLSAFVLGEHLAATTLAGGGLIVAALMVGSAARPDKGRTRREIAEGAAVGVIGIGLMAVAIVAVKGILNRPEVDVLWATWVRVVGGAVGILPLIALHPKRRAIVASLRPTPRSWGLSAAAAFFGTYLAMVAWVGGMKYCDVSRSALLNQLSTIFIFLFATIILKERLTARRGAAIGLAISGAYLVVM